MVIAGQGRAATPPVDPAQLHDQHGELAVGGAAIAVSRSSSRAAPRVFQAMPIDYRDARTEELVTGSAQVNPLGR
jgi:hypothetical protein